MFKKGLPILLAVVMVMSILTGLPFTANAQEVELAEEGADVDLAESGATKKQAEAVQWIKDRADEGWWQDVDYVNGCQCVDLIKAYYDYYGYGTAYYGYAYEYQWDHTPTGSNWYYSDTPIPGSVFVQSAADAGFSTGHVGLVYAVDNTYIYTVETNIVSPYDGGKYYAKAKYNQRYRSRITTYINPVFNGPATNAWLNIDRTEIVTGESITFNFGADNANGLYTIGIDKGNNRIITENIRTTSYTYSFNSAGDYSAYVTCYGDGGLADTNRVYFKVHERIAASNAWIKIDKDTIEKGQSIIFTYGADHANGYYTIGINKGNTRIHTEDIRTTSYTYTFNEVGEYNAYVTCYGYGGLADTQRVYFTVTEPYSASNAWIRIDKDMIEKGQSITFTYGADHSNGYFTIGIDKDDKRIHTKDIQTSSYTYTFTEAGDYSAYVTCYGNGGLADTERIYFKVYEKFPALNAWINIDKTSIIKGQSLTFTYGADHSNGHYTIGIDKDGNRIHTKDIQTSSYTYTFTEVGEYSAYVTCYGDGGLADTEKVYFTVYDDILLGDVDGDGEVTIIDATCIQRKLASIATANFVEAAADADEDGELSVLDATEIQRNIAKLPSNDSIGKPIA